MDIEEIKDLEYAVSLKQDIDYFNGKKQQFRNFIRNFYGRTLNADEIEQITNLYCLFVDKKIVDIKAKFDIAVKKLEG